MEEFVRMTFFLFQGLVMDVVVIVNKPWLGDSEVELYCLKFDLILNISKWVLFSVQIPVCHRSADKNLERQISVRKIM